MASHVVPMTAGRAVKCTCGQLEDESKGKLRSGPREKKETRAMWWWSGREEHATFQPLLAALSEGQTAKAHVVAHSASH